MSTRRSRVSRTPPRLGLIVWIALRGLGANRVVTVLVLGAMAAAVGFQIPNEANLLGYRETLLDEGVRGGLGAVRVTARNGHDLDHVDAMAARVGRMPGVHAAVPMAAMPGLVRSDAGAVRGVVYGVDARAPVFPYRLIAGRLLRTGDDEGVLLGVELATDLGVRVGDRVAVHVVLDFGPQLLDEDRVGRYWMRVRGLVSGVFFANEAAFVERGFLAAESGQPGRAPMLLVYTDDPDVTEPIARRIRHAFPTSRAKTWQRDSEFLTSALGSIDALAAVSAAMGITAVVLPVLALLSIDVIRRRREIALLSAMGLGRGEVFFAFLLQACLAGLVATLVGCALGASIVAWFSVHPIFEFHAFVVRPVTTLACYLRPAGFVLGAAAVAGAVPAWLAARTTPAAVLRGVE